MEKQIKKLELLCHRLCGEPYIEDLPPLTGIDAEYQFQEFETDLDNIDYLLRLLEELIIDITTNDYNLEE